MPSVLNRREFPGRLPPNTVLVDRTTPLGNPFHIGVDGTRDEVCDKYEAWIVTQPRLLAMIAGLRGRHCMCWCWPLRCHATTIVRLANGDVSERLLDAGEEGVEPGPRNVPTWPVEATQQPHAGYGGVRVLDHGDEAP